MRLTRRGRLVVWSLIFLTAFLVGIVTAPYSLDYSNGPLPVVTHP